MLDRPVLFYDGDCRFCRAAVRFIAGLDRKESIAMLPFDDPAADALLASVATGKRSESIHLVQPDGWVLSGGDALLELSRVLPGGDVIASAGWHNDFLRGAFDRGYRFVAEHRGQLSKVAPDGPGPLRPPSPTPEPQDETHP